MAKPRKQKGDEHRGANYSGGVVLHQKLCISIDMEELRIDGHTELKIATDDDYVALHADNMIIIRVSVDGEPAEFDLLPHFEAVGDEQRWYSESSAQSAADVACSTYTASLDIETVPNLLIAFPKSIEPVNCQQDQHMESKEVVISESSDKDQSANSSHNSPVEKKTKLVCVDYCVEKVESAIYFGGNVLLTDNQIRRASCWFPCMDCTSQRCLFDIEFTVSSNFVVVSNGSLLYQVLSKDNPPRITYVYQLKIPVSPEWISLVVAPFEILPDSHNDAITHMCLSPNFSKLKNTIGFFNEAFSYYEEYLSMPFPFGSYKQIFVPSEMFASTVIVGASLSIFSSKLLFDEKIIDETINTRIKLAHALARQWFGIYITAEEETDEWLLDGLAGFLAESFVRHFLGNNEARYRRYKANCAVCKADASGATALGPSSSPNNLYRSHAIIGAYGKIRSWKSIALFQMLEKQMGPDPFCKILRSIVQKSDVSVESGRTLSTKEFRHLANKIGNLERPFLKDFFPRWVESYGCPVLRMGLSYNKRRNMIELAVVRSSTSHVTATAASGCIDTQARDGDNGWPGMMSIRVHELDGMYDHPILPMSGETWQLLEIQCHSRLAAKRIQKPKKGSKLDGSDENLDAASALDVRNGMDSPLLWIRVDPEMEYLAEIHFHQPLQMWINQLEKDKDVVAQAEAISVMLRLPQLSLSIINALNNLLNDSKAFWRVRIEAAYALAHTATEEADLAGLHNLIKFYKNRRFDADTGLPRPNDFHDVPEYFVIEAIPSAVAMVRTAEGKSPREAIEFTLQLLKYNDNNGNPYSDVYWLATLVQAVGELEYCQQSIYLLLSLLKRVERILQFDSLMPSYNGLLTRSCIQTLARIGLKFATYVPFDRVCELIKPYRDDRRTPWEIQIEVNRALLDLDYYSKGLDSAISFFITFLDQQPSLRGQVKLVIHLMHLCQEHVESQVKSSASFPALVILKLLAGRKAFNNIFLRHHLFCILQILASRIPTLHGNLKFQSQPTIFRKTFSDKFKASLVKLGLTRHQEPLFERPDSSNVRVEEANKEIDTVSICSDRSEALKLRIRRPQEAQADAPRTSNAEPVVDTVKEADAASICSEKRTTPKQMVSDRQPHLADTLVVSNALQTVRTAKEADTVSTCSEKWTSILKIRIKQRSSSNSRGDDNGIPKDHSQGAQNDVDVGPCSSLSVDAPMRRADNQIWRGDGTHQNIEDVNSSHDRESRMSASIGSAKLLPKVGEVGKELQCTADSRNLAAVGEQLSPRTNGSIQETYAEDGGEGPSIASARQGESVKPKRNKDKERKRKREEKDRKGHADDTEYSEYKRQKKERKRMEKEQAKRRDDDTRTQAPPPVPLVPARRADSLKADARPRVVVVSETEPRIIRPRNDPARDTPLSSKIKIKIKTRGAGNT